MNRTYSMLAIATAFSAALFAGHAIAQTFGPPASRMAAKTVTVQQAKALADDTEVVVEGRITSRIRDEHYRFEDSSGWIEVEIDDDDWNGVETTASQQVRLIGEVEKSRRSVKLDVDRVERP